MKGEKGNVCEASCKMSYHITCCDEAHKIAKNMLKLHIEYVSSVLGEGYQCSFTFKFHSFEKTREQEL